MAESQHHCNGYKWAGSRNCISNNWNPCRSRWYNCLNIHPFSSFAIVIIHVCLHLLHVYFIRMTFKLKLPCLAAPSCGGQIPSLSSDISKINWPRMIGKIYMTQASRTSSILDGWKSNNFEIELLKCYVQPSKCKCYQMKNFARFE